MMRLSWGSPRIDEMIACIRTVFKDQNLPASLDQWRATDRPKFCKRELKFIYLYEYLEVRRSVISEIAV